MATSQANDAAWVTGASAPPLLRPPRGARAGSDNDRLAAGPLVGPPNAFNLLFSHPSWWPEGEEEHLILALVDDTSETLDQLAPPLLGQLAAEDGVLDMVAKAAQEFEDAAQAFGLCDVVCYQVEVSHASHLVVNGG